LPGDAFGSVVSRAPIACSRLLIVNSRRAPISGGASDSSNILSADFIKATASVQAFGILLFPEQLAALGW
jgi:hypothetical protein